ncbi:DENN domain-containing protein 10 [Aplysia californica]|uniref:DENN domain-containing protein 10 n=1 Tax=Aplysia californica TaxID=6500 RepID=A0ABM0K0C0_APLCA|nr:DENN domain-containing protein 10 [Aplysia californica]
MILLTEECIQNDHSDHQIGRKITGGDRHAHDPTLIYVAVMAVLCDLNAAGIIEKDRNNDVLWTWSYPSVTSEQREFLIAKTGFGTENPLSINFVYSQWKQTWYYIYIVDVTSEDAALSRVAQFALVLLAKDFNPEKYSTLCRLFSRQYKKTGSPVAMLEGYLSVVTRGVCNSDENGKFSVSDYSKQQAYSRSCVKDIIQTFGVETIFIYTAMLLKKRIAIYYPPHSVSNLLDYTRSIPAFAWHRQNWSIVHPFVQLNDAELENLQSNSHYVAGFTEAAVEGRSDLYDLFVNVPNNQITVASHAKDSFAMGKLHKDVATLMVEKADDDSLEDVDVIKEIANKTKDLLNNLKSLATENEDGKLTLSLETLKERRMPPATENFLFSLAASEGFVKF